MNFASVLELAYNLVLETKANKVACRIVACQRHQFTVCAWNVYSKCSNHLAGLTGLWAQIPPDRLFAEVLGIGIQLSFKTRGGKPRVGSYPTFGINFAVIEGNHTKLRSRYLPASEDSKQVLLTNLR